jgi:hypothetical protein
MALLAVQIELSVCSVPKQQCLGLDLVARNMRLTGLVCVLPNDEFEVCIHDYC